MNNEKYHPDKLPSKITKTVYLYYEVRGSWAGEMRIWGQDMHGEDRILLATKQVTIDVPKQIDLKDKMVEALEAQKQRLLSDTHMKVKELQEKINELLMLEYKPLKVVGGSDVDNDLPF